MRLIVPLVEAGTADPSLVGSKARELGRLLAEGTNVPDGFVITTVAHALADGGDVPEVVRDAVAEALAGDWGRLAYRSSAVAEDRDDASYAGQYESVLNVEGVADGLAALRRCWDSARSQALSQYRSAHGHDDGGIAVLVQRMVDATSAGVAFTANPVTGGDEVVIEATPGLGEALLSGDVTPERWVVAAAPRLDAAGTMGSSLNAEQAAAIAAQCAAIAARRGEPLDIEWALDGDRLHILQARPITALPAAPTARPPDHQTWERDDAYFPAPLTPLAFSAWLPYHSESFSHITEHFGLPFMRIDHGHWFGRVYDRVVPLGEPKKDRPLPPLPILKLAIRLAPPFRKRMAIAAAAAAEDRPMRALQAWDDGGRRALRSHTRELRQVDRSALDDGALADHLDEVRAHVLQSGLEHFRASFAGMFIIAGQLGLVMDELLGWEPQRLIDLVGGYGASSVAFGAQLDALAAEIGADADARLLITTDPDRLLGHSGPGGTALRSFIDRHGHRLISANVDDRTWAEDPSPLLRMVAARLDHDASSASDPKAIATAAEEEARALITDPADLARFDRALARARTARPYGDETETDVGDILAVIRYTALEAAARLAARGALAAAGDVFYLTVDELGVALRGGPVPGDIERRKAEHRWAMANQGPARFGPPPGDPPPANAFPASARDIAAAAMWAVRLFMPPAPPDGGEGIRGLAASPGRASGPVRNIRSPAEFDRVRPGDIMVCHHTMAAWSPIFPILGGLVTEHGGPLSHPATLAREYGLPAVLAVPGATELFGDGQVITIDGGAGLIEVTPP
jgi:pyruvate,water dikinase